MFPVQDLGAVLVGFCVHGPLERGAPGLESPRSDVVLEQLVVDNVDHRRNERLDVFGARPERFDVVCENVLAENRHLELLVRWTCWIQNRGTSGDSECGPRDWCTATFCRRAALDAFSTSTL